MPPVSSELPIRQLTRLRAEFSIAFAQVTARMFPDRHSLGIEYGAVARVCLPDWTPGGRLGVPIDQTRAISAHRLAESLGSPSETARRRTRVLVDRGVFVGVRGGLALATTGAGADFAIVYYRSAHDHFLRLVEDAGATCDLALPDEAPASFRPFDVLQRAIDTLLLPIDSFTPVGISSTAYLLWAAFVLIANRRVTHDPALARRYGNALPPDDLRDGISLRRVAASLAIPYTSAWRHMSELIDKGLITRIDDDRWAVLVANRRGEMWDIGSAPTALLLGKLRELARMGLTPARARSAYLDGRPGLAVF